MMDLHVHTTYSDGTLTPEEVVFLAKANGVKLLSITDHDGIDGVLEGIEWGRQYGVKVVPGVELSTGGDLGAYVHLLGYNFDLENVPLKKALKEIREKRKERNDRLLEALNGMGYKLTQEDLYNSLGKGRGTHYIGKPVFAMALKNKGYIGTPKEAFNEGHFLRSEEIKRIHREKITTQEGIALIKGAGGIPVLAHPMKISYLAGEEGGHLQRIERLVARLKAVGLEGMECYYSKHLLFETEHLVEIADKHELLVTAGSDFHGPQLDAQIHIGGFPKNELYEEKEAILAQVL